MMKISPPQRFLTKAQKIHDNFYNYSLVEYININTPVTIICPTHGTFQQKPVYHIQRKSGCPACYRDRQKYDEPYFLALAHEKYQHQFKYGTYSGFQSQITIECTTHGEFSTTPSNHLLCNGGCVQCKNDYQRKSRDVWINEFNQFHSNKYDYSKAIQISSEHKFEAICPGHGSFFPTAHNHSIGHGCPTCAKLYKYVGGYSDGYFKKHPDKKTTLGILYVIECCNTSEHFIKIGITTKTVDRRFASKLAPYQYKILYEHTGQLYSLHQLEQQCLTKYDTYRYIPNHTFSGWTECLQYNTELINNIIQDTTI